MATLFSKPNAIVYVRRSGLLIAGRQIKPARLTFPAGVVSNLEVMQPTKFIRGCQAFFEDQQVKGKRILMVLDQSVVFNSSLEDQTIDDFTSIMPYEPGKRACLYRTSGKQTVVYATNHEFYASIIEALHAAGISKLTAVTPAAAYDLTATDQKFSSAIGVYIADSVVRSQYNFDTVRPL